MRRTKIVATIGPASDSLDVLKELLQQGVNVARLNFSHGTHQEHEQRIVNIRRASAETGIPVAIMVDTKGPEIRTKTVEGGSVAIDHGQIIRLSAGDFVGNADRVAITYDSLADDVEIGDRILIDDGLIELQVAEIQGQDVICKIINGGVLKNNKGINLPGISSNLPSITEKDELDILFAIQQGVEFIAASFIRTAVDVLHICDILERHRSSIQIIAKIESNEAVVNLDEILEVSAGIMVARGDLGVEIPPEEVPLVQKTIIKKCNLAGKPVVTATQMLDSMQRNPRPTRAEASDVANAILDGTDAIMLSGETAAGNFPVDSVRMMAQIAEATEFSEVYQEVLRQNEYINDDTQSITGALSQAIASVSTRLAAKAIVTSTSSGYTARMVSKHRPCSQVIAVTPEPIVSRQLLLSWGVQPFLGQEIRTTDEMFRVAIDVAMQMEGIKSGDLIVITAGVPVGQPGSTNLMKIHIIGEVVCRGTGVGEKSVSGNVRICRTSEQAIREFQEGEILVMYATDKDVMQIIEKAKAIITEEAGITSHAAIVGISLGIPVIVGAKGVLDKLQTGDEVTVDASRGNVYSGRAEVI